MQAGASAVWDQDDIRGSRPLWESKFWPWLSDLSQMFLAIFWPWLSNQSLILFICSLFAWTRQFLKTEGFGCRLVLLVFGIQMTSAAAIIHTAHTRQSRPDSGLGFQVKAPISKNLFPLRLDAAVSEGLRFFNAGWFFWCSGSR